MNQDVGVDMFKLEALLPGYVNGNLASHDRQFVRQALSQSPQARAALAWHEALAEKVINDVDSAPSDIGWSALQAKVRASSHMLKRSATQAAVPSNGVAHLLAKLEWLMPHRWLPAPALGGVCAGLLAVVLAQAWWGQNQSPDAEFSQVRGDTPAAAGATWPSSSKFVRLNFKERVSERDMRLLLVRTGATLVAGPGQLGDYTVAVSASELDKVMQEFKDSLLTESVREVAAPSILDATGVTSTGSAPGNATASKAP
jgi:hypothetical protein